MWGHEYGFPPLASVLYPSHCVTTILGYTGQSFVHWLWSLNTIHLLHLVFSSRATIPTPEEQLAGVDILWYIFKGNFDWTRCLPYLLTGVYPFPSTHTQTHTERRVQRRTHMHSLISIRAQISWAFPHWFSSWIYFHPFQKRHGKHCASVNTTGGWHLICRYCGHVRRNWCLGETIRKTRIKRCLCITVTSCPTHTPKHLLHSRIQKCPRKFLWGYIYTLLKTRKTSRRASVLRRGLSFGSLKGSQEVAWPLHDCCSEEESCSASERNHSCFSTEPLKWCFYACWPSWQRKGTSGGLSRALELRCKSVKERMFFIMSRHIIMLNLLNEKEEPQVNYFRFSYLPFECPGKWRYNSTQRSLLFKPSPSPCPPPAVKCTPDCCWSSDGMFRGPEILC